MSILTLAGKGIVKYLKKSKDMNFPESKSLKITDAAEELAGLLSNKEDMLISKVLCFTALNEEVISPAVHDGWQQTLHFLNEAIITALDTYGLNPLTAAITDNDQENHFSLFIVTEVVKYIRKAYGLEYLMTLFKLYRKVYADFISGQELISSKPCILNYIERIFDNIELNLIREWTIRANDNLQPGTLESESELNRYVSVFDSLPAPVILIDKEFCVVNMNLTALVLFKEIRVGNMLHEYIMLPVIDELCREAGNFLKIPVNEYHYKTIHHTDCSVSYFKVILKKIVIQNNKESLIDIMFQDITEQHFVEDDLNQAIKKAEESDKLKTSFLANMSHEIRTPMNAIIGFTDLLLNEKYLRQDKNEFLKLIRRSSNDLLNIIEDIIDIAKMESKQYKIKFKVCNPFAILCDLKAVFNETLRRFGTDGVVDLQLTVPTELHELMTYTDGERLKQVISNLLNNAIKFTNKGYIEFGFTQTSDHMLLFFVRDTGVGIPEDMKEKVFDRFAQVDEHLRLNVGGTGLGLAICKNIITLLGGTIWVESKVNVGSEFFFEIPLQDIPKELKNKVLNNTDSEPKPGHHWKNKTILIAEDDEINYIFLKEALTSSGAKILHAPNGIAVIDMAESIENIDIILMDIKMPGIDGFEAAKYISKIKPGIPIIAQTAFAMEGDKNRCLNAGCCAYITKPVNINQMLALIEQFIYKEDYINH